MIVDSQVHLWPAPTPERPAPPDAHPHTEGAMTYQAMLGMMDGAGVDRAIIVPPPWDGDRTDYALEAARRHPGRFAVMGRIPVEDPPAARRLLPGWKKQPGMLGVRITFTYETQALLDDGRADWLWPALAEHELPIMLLAPERKAALGRIAKANPKTRLIVDHMGLSMQIKKDGRIGHAIDETVALAEHPNVFVKVSSAPSYSAQDYPFQDMTPHIRRVVEAFGPRRCFWGSDVTRDINKGPYPLRVKHFMETLEFLSEDDKRWIMGGALCDCLGWG